MADENKVATYDMDMGPLEASLKRAVDALKRFGVVLTDISELNKLASKSGKAYVDSLKGFDDQGRKVEASFKNMGAYIQATSVKVIDLTDSINKMNQKYAEADKARSSKEKLAAINAEISAQKRVSEERERYNKKVVAVEQRATEFMRTQNEIRLEDAKASNKKEILDYREKLRKIREDERRTRKPDDAAVQAEMYKQFYGEQVKISREAAVAQSKAQKVLLTEAEDRRKRILAGLREKQAEELRIEKETIKQKEQAHQQDANRLKQQYDEQVKISRAAAVAQSKAQQVLVTEAEDRRKKVLAGLKAKQAEELRIEKETIKQKEQAHQQDANRLKQQYAEQVKISKAAAVAQSKAQQILVTEARQRRQKVLAELRAQKDEEIRIAREAAITLRNEQAKLITSRLASTQGAIPTGATPQQLKSYSAAQQRLQQVISASNVDIARSYQIVSQSVKNFGKVFYGEEGKIAAAARNMQTSFNKLGQVGTQSANTLLFSWQSMFRLFAVQQFHMVVSKLTFAFREAFTSATDFQRRIAEIRTISQDQPLAFQKWADSVRALSIEFGKSTTDVAEGAYQTLSNQVAKGAEVFEFMTTALRFSRAAVTTTEVSVNLLTSAINSFELQASDAERVAGILFKTIELGRIRAEDLHKNFGRVAQVAHQLGVSIEETAASLTTLSIQGITAERAQTLLLNLFLKLIVPTKKMAELFKEHGFESQQAAVEALNFTGILKILNKELQEGGVKRLGAVAGRLRAIQAALGLTGDSFNKFIDDMGKIKDAQRDFENAVKEGFKPASERLAIAFNKVGVTFEAAAQKVQESIVKVADFFRTDLGDAIVSVSKLLVSGTLAAAFGGVTLAVLALGKALFFAEAGAVALAFTTATFIPIVAVVATAIGGLIAYFTLYRKTAAESFEEAVRAQEAAAERMVSLQRIQLREETKALSENLDLQRKIRATKLAEQLKPYFAFAKTQKAIYKEVNKELKKSFKALTDYIEDAIKTTEKRIEKLDKIIKGFDADVKKTNAKLDKVILDIRVEEKPLAEKLKLINAEIQKNLKAFEIPVTIEDGGKSAVEYFKQVQSAVDALIALYKKYDDLIVASNKKVEAQQKKNATLVANISKESSKRDKLAKDTAREVEERLRKISKLEKERNKIANYVFGTAERRREAEKKVDKIDEKIAKEKAEIAKATEKYNEKIEVSKTKEAGLQSKIVEVNKEVAERVKLEERILELQKQQEEAKTKVKNLAEKEREQQQEKLEAQREELKNVAKLTGQLLGTKIDQTDIFGSEKALDTFAEGIQKIQNNKSFQSLAPDQQFRINAALFEKQTKLYETLRMETEKTIFEEQKRQADELANQRKKALEDTRKIENELIDKQKQAIKEIFGALEELDKVGNKMAGGPFKGATRVGVIFHKKITDDLQRQINELGALVDDTTPYRDIFLRISEIQKTIKDKILSPDVSRDEVYRYIDNLTRLFSALGKPEASIVAQNAASAADSFKVAQQRLVDADKKLADIAKQINLNNKSTAETAKILRKEYKRISDLAGEAAKNFNKLAEAKALLLRIRNIEGQQVGTSPNEFAQGGRMHGTDSIHALLSPGETVINAAASRRFRNQLAAMNSGSRRFEQGGAVRNVDVGGINVSVNGGDTSTITLRAIAKGLQREIRRGKISL